VLIGVTDCIQLSDLPNEFHCSLVSVETGDVCDYDGRSTTSSSCSI
jgi:hypothetical protein